MNTITKPALGNIIRYLRHLGVWDSKDHVLKIHVAGDVSWAK